MSAFLVCKGEHMVDWRKLNQQAEDLLSRETLLEFKGAVTKTNFPSFATERMNAFYSRQRGERYQSKFQTINNHHYTNPYRILDRVSQDLIHQIALQENSEPVKFLQCYIFRIFNQVEPYSDVLNNLKENFNWVSALSNDRAQKVLIKVCKSVVSDRKSKGLGVFRPAYKRCTAIPFDNYFDLIKDLDWNALTSAKSLADWFEVLTQLKGFGPFLSYQLALDWNYCSNNPFVIDFVVPGPGAKRGLNYLWGSKPMTLNIALMKWLARDYHSVFNGWQDYSDSSGKTIPLQENDIQNLFCEYSKFTNAVTFGNTPRRKVKSDAIHPLSIVIPKSYLDL